MELDRIGSPGGRGYRAPYGANKYEYEFAKTTSKDYQVKIVCILFDRHEFYVTLEFQTLKLILDFTDSGPNT